ncbi:MAG: STT3 domain-containing protein [Candidatus Woesearchaeota archaeon]
MGRKEDFFTQANAVLNHKLLVVILLVVLVALAFSVRSAPAELAITDQWAQETLQNQLVNQFEQQLRQEFPTLASQQLRNRAIQDYQQFRAENLEELQRQEELLSAQFRREFQIEYERNGVAHAQTYLTGIDPYYYWQRAERVMETGTVCTSVVDGACRDDLMTAPTPPNTRQDWHSYVTGYFAAAAVWMGHLSMTGVFFMPAILASLITIPMFFFVKRRYGTLAGFVAGLVIALHTSLLTRTMAGFSSTDAWNVLFPVLMIFAVVWALEQTENKKQWIGITLAALITEVFSQFWNAWWYAFFVLMGALLATSIYKAATTLLEQYRSKKKSFSAKQAYKNAEQALLTAVGYIAITGITVTVLLGFDRFIDAFTQPFRRAAGVGGLQSIATAELWPNVMRTVAELNPLTIPQTISNIGGVVVFFIVTMGLLLTLIRVDKITNREYYVLAGVAVYYIVLMSETATALNPLLYLVLYAIPFAGLILYNLHYKHAQQIHYAVIGAAFMLAGLFATTSGVRFLLLLVPPIAMGFGFFAGWMVELANKLAEDIEWQPMIATTIVALIMAVLLFAPVTANLYERADRVAHNHVPSMNDAWWDALTEIKENSSEDAIITSWWDFGHWFKAIAERRVTFDGATQNRPAAHWVGKMFLTNDYDESLQILRMLNCGHNTAYEVIQERIQNPARSYDTTLEVLNQTPQQARTALEELGFSEEEITQILDATHCEPPESFVIVSEDMVGKAGVWGYFGGWDFDKATVLNAYQTQPRAAAINTIQERLDVSEEQATQWYNELNARGSRNDQIRWVSDHPSYAGSPRTCQEQNNTLTCPLGLVVAQQNGIQIVADRAIIPKDNPQESTILLAAQGQIIEELDAGILYIDGERVDAGEGLGLAMRIQDNRVLLGTPEIVNSVFTQLFFDETPGEALELLTREQQVTGGKILVYKVNWDAVQN